MGSPNKQLECERHIQYLCGFLGINHVCSLRCDGDRLFITYLTLRQRRQVDFITPCTIFCENVFYLMTNNRHHLNSTDWHIYIEKQFIQLATSPTSPLHPHTHTHTIHIDTPTSVRCNSSTKITQTICYMNSFVCSQPEFNKFVISTKKIQEIYDMTFETTHYSLLTYLFLFLQIRIRLFLPGTQIRAIQIQRVFIEWCSTK